MSMDPHDNAKGRLAALGRQKAKGKGQKAKGRCPAGFFRLVAQRHLPFAFCPLPFAFCLPSVARLAFCLLPFAFCLASAARAAVTVDTALSGERARSGASE